MTEDKSAIHWSFSPAVWGVFLAMSLLLVVLCSIYALQFAAQSPQYRQREEDALTTSGTLLFVQGVDPGKDFDALLSYIYGDNIDALHIARSVSDALFRQIFGDALPLEDTLRSLHDAPYALLLEQGSGGTLHWLAALQSQEDMQSTTEALERGFALQFSLAVVRERTMPDGKVYRDVVANPQVMQRSEKRYRQYDLRIMSHDVEQLIVAHRHSAYLLSNNEELLQRGIDTGFLARYSTFFLSRAGFDRLRALVPDSDMIRHIDAILPLGGELCPLCLFCPSPVVLP